MTFPASNLTHHPNGVSSFGLPVIGARESGSEDALLDGKNGYLVGPTDVDAAAEKMVEIVSTPALRAALSRESIAFAKRCDWKIIIKEYSDLYELLFRKTV